MQLIKVYFWMLEISLSSFGGAYSIWALLVNEAGRDCPYAMQSASASAPGILNACRDHLHELMAISGLLPGPQVNGIAMTGYAEHGVAGMIAIVLGLITPGLVLIPALLWLVRQHFSLALVQLFFTGAGIATTAILAYFAFTLLKPFCNLPRHQGILLASCCIISFFLSYRFGMHPGLIVLFGAVFGYVIS